MIDLEYGLRFLALRRLAKDLKFLSRVTDDSDQVPKNRKTSNRKERQMGLDLLVADASGDHSEIAQSDKSSSSTGTE